MVVQPLQVAAAQQLDAPPVLEVQAKPLLLHPGTGILVEPEGQGHPCCLAAQAGPPLGGLQIPAPDGLPQPVADALRDQVQAVVPTQGHQQFPDHRQQMGADVEDHPVRVAQQPPIRLPGGEVEGIGMPRLVQAAGFQQKALHRADIGEGGQPDPGAAWFPRLPAFIQFAAQQQLLDGIAGHPVIQRQHPGCHLGVRQQGAQAIVLGQGGHHGFLHQDEGNGAGQCLLQHGQMQQGRRGDHQPIQGFGQQGFQGRRRHDAGQGDGGIKTPYLGMFRQGGKCRQIGCLHHGPQTDKSNLHGNLDMACVPGACPAPRETGQTGINAGWAPASVRPLPGSSPCAWRSLPPDRAGSGPRRNTCSRGGRNTSPTPPPPATWRRTR